MQVAVLIQGLGISYRIRKAGHAKGEREQRKALWYTMLKLCQATLGRMVLLPCV